MLFFSNNLMPIYYVNDLEISILKQVIKTMIIIASGNYFANLNAVKTKVRNKYNELVELSTTFGVE